MKLCRLPSRLAFALFLLAAPITARAQLSAYATFSIGGVDDLAAGTYVDFFCQNDLCSELHSATDKGFLTGISFDIPHSGRFYAAADLRGAVYPGSVGGSTVLAGVKVGFNPIHNRLRPYAQLSAGHLSGHTPTFATIITPTAPDYTGPTLSTSDFIVQTILGLDLRLTSRLDLRLLELDVPSGSSLLTAQSNGSTYIAGNVLAVNFGVVFHLTTGVHAKP